MNRVVLLENRWVKLYEDKYQLPGGYPCTYYHVERQNAVMAIALEVQTSGVYTYLVKQYRHPIGKEIWQFPLGGIEDNQCAINSARKELLEEVGLVVGEVSEVLSFYTDPGFSNQKMSVCISTDIQKTVHQNLEETETDLVFKRVSLEKVSELIRKNVSDAWTVIGYQEILNHVGTNAFKNA